MKEQYIDKYGIDSLPNLKDAARIGAVFVTNNRKIIKDREELQEVFKIKIMMPKEILKDKG